MSSTKKKNTEPTEYSERKSMQDEDDLPLVNDIDDNALHDMIATRAYEIWQGEGCPEGRAENHWMRAVEWLRSELHAMPR